MNVPTQQTVLFTDEDQMFPVYCPQCKAHIPRALSNVQKICNGCQSQAAYQSAAQIQLQQAQMQQFYATNTGLGICQQCQSTNIGEQTSGSQGCGQAAFGIAAIVTGLLGFFFCPLWCGTLLFIGLMFVVPRDEISRWCKSCGNRWIV